MFAEEETQTTTEPDEGTVLSQFVPARVNIPPGIVCTASERPDSKDLPLLEVTRARPLGGRRSHQPSDIVLAKPSGCRLSALLRKHGRMCPVGAGHCC